MNVNLTININRTTILNVMKLSVKQFANCPVQKTVALTISSLTPENEVYPAIRIGQD